MPEKTSKLDKRSYNFHEKKTKKKDLFKNLKKKLHICNEKKKRPPHSLETIMSICELKYHFFENQNVKYFPDCLKKIICEII